MDIGGKIKRMRIEKQLTQEELANRCELSKGFISQLENNLTSPSIATLIDILEILGTNLREFFNEIDDERICFTKDDMFETEDEDLKYTLKWLVPNSQKNEMEPIIITLESGGQYKEEKPQEKVAEYLLVDGYNVIFAWDELKELAKDNLNMARDRLIDILCNYQGFKQCNLILVFDAYKVKGNVGSAEKIHNINVVYTKEAETADMYIEKITHEIGKKHRVRVATSDNLEQIIILGNGATRLSANELLQEVKLAEKTIMDIINSN